MSDDLRAEYERVIAEQASVIDGQVLVIEELRAQVVELRRLLEESRRGGKRQAAPFSKGLPSMDLKRPGRKPGEGTFRRRAKPERGPDRVVLAGLPAWCPCCGDEVVLERVAEQWMTELPRAACGGDAFRCGDRPLRRVRDPGAGPPPRTEL